MQTLIQGKKIKGGNCNSAGSNMEQRKYAYALKQSILRLQLKIKTKISYQPEKLT